MWHSKVWPLGTESDGYGFDGNVIKDCIDTNSNHYLMKSIHQILLLCTSFIGSEAGNMIHCCGVVYIVPFSFIFNCEGLWLDRPF